MEFINQQITTELSPCPISVNRDISYHQRQQWRSLVAENPKLISPIICRRFLHKEESQAARPDTQPRGPERWLQAREVQNSSPTLVGIALCTQCTQGPHMCTQWSPAASDQHTSGLRRGQSNEWGWHIGGIADTRRHFKEKAQRTGRKKCQHTESVHIIRKFFRRSNLTHELNMHHLKITEPAF